MKCNYIWTIGDMAHFLGVVAKKNGVMIKEECR
jgi:hypothetical protein